MNPVSARWRDITAAVALFLISVWLTWPLTPRLATALNSSPDSLLNAWALGWGMHVLPQDPLSLFQANIFAPRPDTLAFSEHLFGILVLVAPAYYLSGNLLLANNLAILLSFWLCGLGSYFLVKEITTSRWAGLVSGVLLLAAPYRFQHLVQIQLLSFQWLLFALWAFARYMKQGRRRDWLALAAFTLLQALSCNYYAVYTGLAFVVVATLLLVMGVQRFGAQRVVGLGGAAVVVGMLALPFVLPYQRTRSEQGFYRRIEDVIHFSARPIDFLRPSSYNRAPHWNVLPRDYASERVLFPGFMAAALAATGLLIGWPRDQTTRKTDGEAPPSPENQALLIHRVLFLTAIALVLVGGILSLGPQLQWGESVVSLPYRFLYRHIPGFNGLRVPARLAVLCLIGTTLLAGFGTARLLRLVWQRRQHVLVTGFGVAILSSVLFDVQTYSLDRAFPEAPEIPRIYQWLREQPGDGAVLVLPIHEGDAITEESLAMYHSTVHFKPLVNGFSGWWPNDYWELVGRLRHFPTTRSLRFLLERAPVEFVVIQYDRFDDVRRRHLLAAMERYRERLPLQIRIGNDAIYRVAESASEALSRPDALPQPARKNADLIR